MSGKFYSEMEELISTFNSFHNTEYSFVENNSKIDFRYNNEVLFQTTVESIEDLNSGNKLKGNNLRYFKDYGIIAGPYAELCVDIRHSRYPEFGNFINWIDGIIKFNIGEKYFELGEVSPLFRLLCETPYRDSEYPDEFDSLISIKVYKTNKKKLEHDIQKAFYYLNSFYLSKSRTIVTMSSLRHDDEYIDQDYLYDYSGSIQRRRTNIRNDLISIEPIKLYNYAQKLTGDAKFLQLFRILEYFMDSLRTKRINEIRYDTAYDDKEIIKEARISEQIQFQKLITSICEGKNNIEKPLVKHTVKSGSVGKAAEYIYKYRNSIVHAKEAEINNTRLPSLFDEELKIDKLNRLMNMLAIQSIRKFNEKNTTNSC